MPTLALLVGLWFACWWIGRTPLTAADRLARGGLAGRPGRGGAGGLVRLHGALCRSPRFPGSRSRPTALAHARADGKTVMVDFTANWCPNCKTNSKLAIETDAVGELIKANGVVPMLADWTDQSPTIKKALNDLGYNSIPLLAIWPAKPGKDGKEVIKLRDVLRESQVLGALKEAGPSTKR